jgi:hypothetical protein
VFKEVEQRRGWGIADGRFKIQKEVSGARCQKGRETDTAIGD